MNFIFTLVKEKRKDHEEKNNTTLFDYYINVNKRMCKKTN